MRVLTAMTLGVYRGRHSRFGSRLANLPCAVATRVLLRPVLSPAQGKPLAKEALTTRDYRLTALFFGPTNRAFLTRSYGDMARVSTRNQLSAAIGRLRRLR